MRVLSIIHYPTFGGPHNRNLRLAGPLSERGVQVTAVIPDEDGNAADRFQSGGMPFVQLSLHRLRASADPLTQLRFAGSALPEIRALQAAIRAHNIDVVLINGLVNPHGAIAARLEGIPVVWQLLDTRPPMALRKALMPVVTRLSDVIMTTGMEVARVHPGASSFGDRLAPFYPPVDTNTFRPDENAREAARAELAVPEDAYLVGTVGNLNPQKGHEHLLQAMSIVRKSRQDVVARILGAHTPTQDGYERELRAEARRHNLAGDCAIDFVNPGPRVPELLPAFDAFLLTSVPRSEGVPTTVLEAMACGVPVIATDVGAVREVVEDGITGYVVPPLDAEAIAQATLKLLADSDTRHSMGGAARQRAVERYDVEVCADAHVRAFEKAAEHLSGQRRSRRQKRLAVSEAPDIREFAVCPACRGGLKWQSEEARCGDCRRSYPIVDGIPLLVADRLAAEHDELEHHHSHGHKHRQAEYFDREEAAEFETRRPHETPALYRWLMIEKFRRSLRGLRPLTHGGTALTVCGGSGMDAEFLARSGLRVIASDISIGAARRARERAQRYGLPITPIVADVEALPFADQTMNLVYVHDGLHHLARPADGLSEMARVASKAVSVTEPARAAATSVAVRLGLALEREEAGNRVARLTGHEVSGPLISAGFKVTHNERYAMYYRHTPGALEAALSTPGIFPLVRSAWRAANLVVGHHGNKLTVQAIRD